MAQWINLNRNNRSASIFCIVRKNWAHAPTASGSYAGWLAGWQMKCGWISKFLKFSTG